MTPGAVAVVKGGLTVGVLDGLFAVVYWGLRSVGPMRVFRGVAAGWLGRPAAAAGGVPTFLLGLATHFLIAFCVAGAYFLATRKLPVLVRHWVPCGLLYGAAVHTFMTFVVIPLSRIGPGRFAWPNFLLNIAGHALLVGLPAAYFASRSAGPR
jgi:hypothetical protein